MTNTKYWPNACELYNDTEALKLLLSRSEYPRDQPFLLTMVSYLKKYKLKLREKKKSNEPFQSYLLTGQANSAKKAG